MPDPKFSHLFIHIFGMFCNVELYSFPFKILCHHLQAICRRNINAVDCCRIYDHNLSIFLNTVLNICLEDFYICKEQILAETVYHCMPDRICIAVSLQIIIGFFSGNHSPE